MKKIFAISLIAMTAVSAANAQIASKAYVDARETAANTYTDTKIGTLPQDPNGQNGARYATVADAIAGSITEAGGQTAGQVSSAISTALANSGNAYQTALDVTTTLGSYYTKTEANNAFVEDADIANMQTTTNLSSSIATDTGSTTKYPSVAAVEAAITSLDLGNTYQAKGDYATAAQGAKADTAVQNITAGDGNGQIKVDGTNINVTGLGTAAYTASTAYDAAGTAATAIAGLDSSATATSNEVVTGVTLTDGVVTVSSGDPLDTAAYGAGTDGVSVLTRKGSGTDLDPYVYAWETIQR